MIDTQLDSSAEKVMLGKITGVYGLQGWVKIHSDTNPRENITTYKSWLLQQAGQWSRVTVTGGRPQGKTIVAQIADITTPELASTLIGAVIAVERTELPVLSAGEYYWADLAGMKVKTVDGQDVGSVLRLFETGANDVVVISDERDVEGNARPEILVPWVLPDVITDVNLESRVITIDWDPDF